MFRKRLFTGWWVFRPVSAPRPSVLESLRVDLTWSNAILHPSCFFGDANIHGIRRRRHRVPRSGRPPSLRCDKKSLLAVRDRLRGRRYDLLRTWQPDIGIENFEGVSLGGDPRRVIGLEIVRERSDASGDVPWQLSRLPRLERLVLRGNGLQGLIPPALGQLRELRELQLRDNRSLTGCISPGLVPACDCPGWSLCE